MAPPKEHLVPVGTIKLRCLEWGPADAPAVLLVHGFTQTADSWRDFAAQLADSPEPYRVVACDLRGHGRSAWPADGDYSREAMSGDVLGICSALSLRPVLLVGMSMGGAIATAVAAADPALVHALVLVDWAPWPEDASGQGQATIGVKRIGMVFTRKWPTFDAAVSEMHRFNPRRSKEGIAERLQYQLRQLPPAEGGKWVWATDPRIVKDAEQRRSEPPSVMWDKVRSLRCPTLVVRGAVSDVLQPAQAIRLADTLPAPDSRLHTVLRAGHSVAGDNPSGFYHAVAPFFAAHRPGTAHPRL
eukprot:TRINITY_DN20646_c0_g1_i1.p1 TRINITY_DN20646_c0_g1~~TRINITY_DN20646_c0_g1_i1.p1  ORF type:complete len:324 (+),score=102.36 TRINITY_DN20646_c0_g1_i1:72-974(+)